MKEILIPAGQTLNGSKPFSVPIPDLLKGQTKLNPSTPAILQLLFIIAITYLKSLVSVILLEHQKGVSGPQHCPLTVALEQRDEGRDQPPSSIKEPLWDLCSDPGGNHRQPDVRNVCLWLTFAGFNHVTTTFTEPKALTLTSGQKKPNKFQTR